MPDPIDVYIGSCIRLRRLEKGLSQERLAAALGLSFQQIQKYERGLNACAPARLAKIARILDMPIASFLPEAGVPAQTAAALPDARSLAFARQLEAIPSREARAAIRQLVSALAVPTARF
jgi:transcriptional regulator with XRE-family HTH domain